MILTSREMTITPLGELRCSTISDLKALKNRLGWHDRDVVIFDSGYHTPFHLDSVHYEFSEEELVMMFGNPMHRHPFVDQEQGVAGEVDTHVCTHIIAGRGSRVLV